MHFTGHIRRASELDGMCMTARYQKEQGFIVEGVYEWNSGNNRREMDSDQPAAQNGWPIRLAFYDCQHPGG